MKLKLPAYLLTAALWVYIPSPCSAQDAAEGTEASPAVPVQEVSAVEMFRVMLEHISAEDRQINELLHGITDKETADAAAEAIEECCKRIEACTPDSDEAYTRLVTAAEEQGGDPEALIDEYSGPYLEVLQTVATLAVMEPPYYGSEKLQSALLHLAEDTEYAEEDGAGDNVYTQEQLEAACAYMDEAFSHLAPLKQALLGVTDKESADAAAPTVSTLREEIDNVWSRMSAWMEESGSPDSLVTDLLEYYSTELEIAEEVDGIISRLSEADTPFYGSEALENALRMDESGEETSTPAE